MLRPTKALLACLTVALALLASVTTASANSISYSSRTFRTTFTPLRIGDTGPFMERGAVSCNVTLEGSYHSSTIHKVSEALVGYITRASMASPCTGGTASFLSETLPWHLEYESFAGTLPNITRIQDRIAGLGLSVDPTEGMLPLCLAHSESVIWFVLGAIAAAEIGAYIIADLYMDSYMLRRMSCGTDQIEIFGEGPATVLGSTSRITVALI